MASNAYGVGDVCGMENWRVRHGSLGKQARTSRRLVSKDRVYVKLDLPGYSSPSDVCVHFKGEFL